MISRRHLRGSLVVAALFIVLILLLIFLVEVRVH